MITKRSSGFFLTFLLMLCFVLPALFSKSAMAANFPLEIINIKPSGTGNPPIPTTNRIFRAYPGIEYNIRAAVIGGLYPYTYSLSNAPSGMTINSRTGEVRWPNPQSSASNIQLTVVDSESTQVQTTWSITVTDSTSTFRFVQAGYSGTQTGSITQPYSSLANAIAAGGDIILYFRQGTYSYTGIPGGENGYIFRSDTPKTWTIFPGEAATINMNDTRLGSPIPGYIYFDNLTFTNMDYMGIVLWGVFPYHTIRRCTFDDFTNSNGSHDNQGVIMSLGSESIYGSYSVIQDNYITNFRASAGNIAAIGSLYRMQKLLIENNYIYGNNCGSEDKGIFTKSGTHTFTIRGNKIIMVRGRPIYYGNYPGNNMDNNEYLYNLFVVTNERNCVFNAYETVQGSTWYRRNTIITDMVIRSCASTGPFTITTNVISNPNTNWSEGTASNYITYGASSGCATNTNQLASTNTASLVDAGNEYKLVSGQSQYIGTRGWQLSDGLTPLELGASPFAHPAPNQPGGSPSVPSGLVISK